MATGNLPKIWLALPSTLSAGLEDWRGISRDLEELIVIVSYSEISGPALNHHHPRVIADQIACEDVTGWASTTLHVADGLQDITYTSGVVNLRFKVRDVQDVPGNIYYDLSAQSQGVHWVASGTYGGCPAEGETTVLFPGVPYTGLEFAAGYLVVVGPGDNHSTIVMAYDPAGDRDRHLSRRPSAYLRGWLPGSRSPSGPGLAQLRRRDGLQGRLRAALR